MEKSGVAKLGQSLCVSCNLPATTIVRGQLSCKKCARVLRTEQEKSSAVNKVRCERVGSDPREIMYPEKS
jgi:hypothetical protein